MPIFVDALRAWPQATSAAASEPAPEPLTVAAMTQRLLRAVVVDLEAMAADGGDVDPAVLAEALYEAAASVATACKADGGPARWAAEALLRACVGDVEVALAAAQTAGQKALATAANAAAAAATTPQPDAWAQRGSVRLAVYNGGKESA